MPFCRWLASGSHYSWGRQEVGAGNLALRASRFGLRTSDLGPRISDPRPPPLGSVASREAESKPTPGARSPGSEARHDRRSWRRSSQRHGRGKLSPHTPSRPALRAIPTPESDARSPLPFQHLQETLQFGGEVRLELQRCACAGMFQCQFRGV
jgi:hypothetical protein